MDHDAPLKELVWVGSSKRDFRDFPEEVKDDMGYARFQIDLIQKRLKDAETLHRARSTTERKL